jgi:hypothetical protein
MQHQDLIIENYRRLNDAALREIARKPQQLEPEVLPYLQEELRKRDLHKEAEALMTYLLRNDNDGDEQEMTIQERLDAGEPIESIRLDLQERGLDMFSLMKAEEEEQERVAAYIDTLKDQQLTEEEIGEKVKEAFGLEQSDAVEIQKNIKQRGRQNIIVGFVLLLISFILLVLINNGVTRAFNGLYVVMLMLSGILIMIRGAGQVK